LKNQRFQRRLAFAASGVRFAAANERSFRSQLGLGLLLAAVLLLLRPPAVWWALCLLAAGLVLTAELINTALEQALDRLHPEAHDGIRVAKDCAAGAVLLASMFAACVGVLTVLVAFGLVR
jgi:diacylglycerol kinase (ATP)